MPFTFSSHKKRFKVGHIALVSILGLFFLSSSVASQKTKHSVINPRIHFGKGSYQLNEAGKKEINRLAKAIIEESILNDIDIKLQIINHPSETQIDRFIGVKRAKIVLDYFTDNHPIDKRLFFIREVDSEKYFDPSEFQAGWASIGFIGKR